jgi:hypothetical protein
MSDFSAWPTSELAAQCRMQARDNLDPEYSRFMLAVADHLDKWQPIDTAPRDGTEILLYGLYPENDQGLPTQRVTAGFWLVPEAPVIGDCGGECRCPEYGEPAEPDWCTMHGGSSGGWMSTDGGFTEEWPATHWRPLPPPPSTLK